MNERGGDLKPEQLPPGDWMNNEPNYDNFKKVTTGPTVLEDLVKMGQKSKRHVELTYSRKNISNFGS